MDLALSLPPRRAVPCAGCTDCCRGRQLVALGPTDDASAYKTQIVGGVVALAMKPNGDCIYLQPGGCGIHARAPAVCRAFDCRDEPAVRERR